MSTKEHTRSPYRIAYEGLLAVVAGRGRSEAAYAESLERDSKGLIKPAVSLKVCDEFPTAAAVQAETVRRMNELCDLYPLPNGDRYTGQSAMHEPVNGEPVATAEDIPF